MCNYSGNTAYDGVGLVPRTVWRDRRFKKVGTTARLVYLYLLTGPEFSPSGIFAVSPLAILDFAGGWKSSEGLRELKTVGLIEYEELSDYTIVWLDGIREYYIATATLYQEAQIARDINKLPLESNVVQIYLDTYGLAPGGSFTSSEMEKAVAKVTKTDLVMFGHRERDFCERLHTNYTPEDVEAVFGKDGAWYKHDWRGRKGDLPTMAQVGKIGRLIDKVGLDQEPPVDVEAVAGTVTSLIRNNKGYGYAKAHITERYGGSVWNRLIAHLKWGTARGWKSLPEGQIEWEVRKARVNG